MIGPPTVSVPGCVRGWFMLHERFGTRPIGELLAAGHPLCRARVSR